MAIGSAGVDEMKEYSFIQEIKIDSEIIPLVNMISCAYIECGDLSGPKLILKLSDQAGYLRDDFGIKKGVIIEISMGDISADNDDLWIEKFECLKASSESGILTLEGFSEFTSKLKRIASKPRFFVDKTPAHIIKALIPESKLNIDSFPAVTYHLNSGMTISRLLRVMARDCGAMCWFSRGEFNFKSIRSITQKSADLTLEANKNQSDINVLRYTIQDEQEAYSRILEKCFYSWDTVNGLEKSSVYPDNPPVYTSLESTLQLDNQSTALAPQMLVETLGNNDFSPGVNVNVIIHKFSPENALDESIPEKQIIYQVTHYQQGDRYNCKLELMREYKSE